MLPKLPYAMKKNKQQMVAMRGINFSSATQDGDVADSKGISARAYPYITTAKAWGATTSGITDANVTDFTYFNGKMVTVRKTAGRYQLYYGEINVCYVSPTPKQFAKINTKLVIFPDKIYLDSNGNTGSLEASVTTSGKTIFEQSMMLVSGSEYEVASGYGCKFEGNVITTRDRANIIDDLNFLSTGEPKFLGNDEYETQTLTLFESITDSPEEYTVTIGYDKDGARVETWIAVNGINHAEVTGKIRKGAHIHIVETNRGEIQVPDDYSYLVYDIEKKWGLDHVQIEYTRDKVSESYEHYRMELLIFQTVTNIEEILKDEKDVVIDGELYEIDPGSVWSSGFRIIVGDNEAINSGFMKSVATPGWIGLDNVKEGDFITITGTKRNADGDFTSPIANNDTTCRVLSVAGNTITCDTIFVSEESQNASVSISSHSDNKDVSFSKFKVGDAVTLSGCSNPNNNTTVIIDKIEGDAIYVSGNVFTEGEDTAKISISRSVPDLDLICESNNRLWGCSNADKTIYVSALGDPTNIYAYQGISTDSFAVAVASEGDFTACVPYGDSVLFWKTDKLHKVVGSYPAEYALYTYNVNGVQAGSNGSIAIINEVLYYKGNLGVYAYSGGVPQLISSGFGEKRFHSAIAGADGDSYVIAMKDEREKDFLFVYETALGMWVLEDSVAIKSIFGIDDKLHMLTENGEVYLYGAAKTLPDHEWFVQFTPFYETIEGKKSYSRIALRVEIPNGSYLAVSVRCDGGIWREVGKVVGRRMGVVPIVIPINRCDKFELKISGKGECTILSMVREFYVKGDR